MRSALYYPHTSVENEDLVKTALILWDRLDYIVPWEGFKPHYDDPLIARAMEMIGAPRVPNSAEKKETHAHIEELVNRRLPPQFYFSRRPRGPHAFEMYPQKLLPDTWDLLQESRLSGRLLPNADYPMTEPAGLTIMSVLADCCAGKTKCRVTDRGDAYATLAGLLGADSDNKHGKTQTPQEQLVPITLEIINPHSFDLKKLIKFREREEKRDDYGTRDLRHRYIASLEKYVERLTTHKANQSDAAEIKRQFADDMKIDLHNLKTELRSVGQEALLSKEILLTALAGLGTVATWTFGASLQILGTVTALGTPATVGGLLSAGNKYLSARRKIMQQHPMAYLYKLQ